MMLAWLSSSEITTSSLDKTAATVPAFAAKPLWKTTTASVFLKAARRRSSSMWMSMVPAMERTEPEPTPRSRTASSAFSRSRGCVVRPR